MQGFNIEADGLLCNVFYGVFKANTFQICLIVSPPQFSGADFSAQNCIDKWKSEAAKSKKYEDHQKSTGRGYRPQPSFHDPVMNILRGSHVMGGILVTSSLDPPPTVNVTGVDINPADFLVQSLASDSQEIESSMPSPLAVQPPFILEDHPDYETEHEDVRDNETEHEDVPDVETEHEDVIRFQPTHVHQELDSSMQSEENELPDIENEDPGDAVFQASPVIGFTKRSAQTPIPRANKVPRLAVPSNRVLLSI